jgi:hypothetical protein
MKQAPFVTDSQRTALIPWGVDRDRAEGPGLTSSETSKRLEAWISEERRENGGSGATVPTSDSETGTVRAG